MEEDENSVETPSESAVVEGMDTDKTPDTPASEQKESELFKNNISNPNPEDSGSYSAEHSKKESSSSDSSGDFLLSDEIRPVESISEAALENSPVRKLLQKLRLFLF